MRNYLLILFTIFVANTSDAQKLSKDTAFIELACGIIGYTCPEIVSYKKLVAAKKYDVVKEKLANGTMTEKVLSAMVIEKLKHGRLVSLTAAEERTYISVITSKQRVQVCYTCSWHFKATIKEFFHPKQVGGMTDLTPYGRIRDELFSR
jgi:hypothetical protein